MGTIDVYFLYVFILNPFFCMICIVLGFRGFKEISESKGRIFFETLRDQCVMAHNVVKIGWFYLEQMLI